MQRWCTKCGIGNVFQHVGLFKQFWYLVRCVFVDSLQINAINNCNCVLSNIVWCERLYNEVYI